MYVARANTFKKGFKFSLAPAHMIPTTCELGIRLGFNLAHGIAIITSQHISIPVLPAQSLLQVLHNMHSLTMIIYFGGAYLVYVSYVLQQEIV